MDKRKTLAHNGDMPHTDEAHSLLIHFSMLEEQLRKSVPDFPADDKSHCKNSHAVGCFTITSTLRLHCIIW
jgi:hypothetical protein